MSSNPSSHNAQVQQAQQMFNALSQSRKILLIAGVVGFIVSFFPWTTATVGEGGFSASGSDSGWHGFGIIAILLFIVAALWVVLPMVGFSPRSLLSALPSNLNESRVVMIAGGLALLCTLLDMFIENPANYSGPGVSHGPAWGAFLALIVSAAIIASGYLMQNEPASA